MENFEQLLNESLAEISFRPNEIIEASVVGVDRHKVIIDVGLHIEGHVMRSEFIEPPQVGEKIRVVVDALDDGDGQLKITHKEVMLKEQKALVPEWVENNTIVDAKIVSVAKAGLNVQIGYMTGFIPRKLVDIIPVVHFDKYINQMVRVKVLSYDPTHENLVVSRKAALLDERGGVIPNLDRELEIGETIEGKIINIKKYGAFVDIGGVSPLLHISDLDWDGTKASVENLNLGDRITVMIKDKDSDTNRYFLSAKHIDMAPWEEAKTTLAVNTSHKAEVIKVEDSGDIRVSLNGVTGFVKFDEISWTRMTTSSVSNEFRRGMVIDVMVQGYDDKFGFESILLSHKACLANPWSAFTSEFKQGDKIESTIKSVGDKMLFINVAGDIDAIVPAREISWDNSKDNIVKYKVGDKVTAILTTINADDRRVVASIKQASPNPFDFFKRGNKVEGVIVGISSNGDIEVKCGTEEQPQTGVILSRNAVPSRAFKTKEVYEIGQKIKGVVIGMLQNGLISLSVDKFWFNDKIENNAMAHALEDANINS